MSNRSEEGWSLLNFLTGYAHDSRGSDGRPASLGYGGEYDFSWALTELSLLPEARDALLSIAARRARGWTDYAMGEALSSECGISPVSLATLCQLPAPVVLGALAQSNGRWWIDIETATLVTTAFLALSAVDAVCVATTAAAQKFFTDVLDLYGGPMGDDAEIEALAEISKEELLTALRCCPALDPADVVLSFYAAVRRLGNDRTTEKDRRELRRCMLGWLTKAPVATIAEFENVGVLISTSLSTRNLGGVLIRELLRTSGHRRLNDVGVVALLAGLYTNTFALDNWSLADWQLCYTALLSAEGALFSVFEALVGVFEGSAQELVEAAHAVSLLLSTQPVPGSQSPPE